MMSESIVPMYVQSAGEDNIMIENQTFQDLYGYFLGMMNRGNLDELYVRALEAIPTLVFLQKKEFGKSTSV